VGGGRGHFRQPEQLLAERERGRVADGRYLISGESMREGISFTDDDDEVVTISAAD
jgi:hypothetical protein